MKVSMRLESAIVGPGFVLKRGYHSGEMDDRGLIWIAVIPTNRQITARIAGRKVGVHAAKFSYVEPFEEQSHVDPRAEINAKIKAAEKAAKERRV